MVSHKGSGLTEVIGEPTNLRSSQVYKKFDECMKNHEYLKSIRVFYIKLSTILNNFLVKFSAGDVSFELYYAAERSDGCTAVQLYSSCTALMVGWMHPRAFLS